MGIRSTLASGMRRFADVLGRPAFSGTPFPTGGIEKPAQLKEELGSAGTFNFGGFLRGVDPNPALDGQAGIKLYDEMRRDSQVHASLEVVKQPIRAADYEVDASDPNDPEAIHYAEFVRWNLFTRMTTSWDDLLRQSLLMLDFGFMLFEKVWSYEDDANSPYHGHIVIHKMAARPPKTVWQWFTDEDGALLSIKQLAVKAGSYQFLDIPASKLVRFTYQQEGDDFTGISMLRSSYPNWAFKKQFYVIDAIRAARFGVGIPRAKLKEGFQPSTNDRTAMATMLQGMSSHEHAYLIQPPQYDVDILMPQGVRGGADLMPSIEHHNGQITRNILAQFLDMGGRASGGSRALGASAMDFFLNAIDSLARQQCDTLQKQLIVDMIDMNFDAKGKYPVLRPVGIQNTDPNTMAAAVAALGSAGFLTPDKNTENTLRAQMNLPEVKDEEDVAMEGEQPGAAPSVGSGLAAPPKKAATALPATAISRAALPATFAPTPATPATADLPATVEAGDAEAEVARPADGPERRDWPAEGASMRPVIEPTDDPAKGHAPQVEPARSTYYQDRPADASGSGVRRVEPATIDVTPAVAAQRAPTVADGRETRALPAETATLPSKPERMARSSTLASSGDADEEGHLLTEVGLSTRSRRNARPWTAPDGQTTFWRMPTELETRALDLREMPSKLHTARTALRGTLLAVRREQILRIATAVAHAGADEALKAPLVGKMASDIAKAMRSAYEYGQDVVKQELRRQRSGSRSFAFAAPRQSDAQIPHLVASAQLSAQTSSDKLLASARAESLRLKRAGWEEDEIEDALKIHMGELGDADIGRLASMEVNEAFSMGRTAAAEGQKGQIEKAIYSAILDDQCCEPCEKNDGMEVSVDSDEYEELMPPFQGCLGDDQCRCMWIYELSPEGDDQ